MKVWWVLGYDAYYPSVDNFEASFETEKEANEYASKTRTGYQYYEVINIEDRLR